MFRGNRIRFDGIGGVRGFVRGRLFGGFRLNQFRQRQRYYILGQIRVIVQNNHTINRRKCIIPLFVLNGGNLQQIGDFAYIGAFGLLFQIVRRFFAPIFRAEIENTGNGELLKIDIPHIPVHPQLYFAFLVKAFAPAFEIDNCVNPVVASNLCPHGTRAINHSGVLVIRVYQRNFNG